MRDGPTPTHPALARAYELAVALGVRCARAERAIVGALVLSWLGSCGGDDRDGGWSPAVTSGHDSDAGDAESTSASSMTPQACFDTYLSQRGEVCFGDCGQVLSCVGEPDCLICSEQCLPPACTTNAECQEQFGDLCPGVSWICEMYLLAPGCTVDLGGGGGEESTGGGAGTSCDDTTRPGECASETCAYEWCGTACEGVCPESWNGDGGCDCGCQFVDVDCDEICDNPSRAGDCANETCDYEWCGTECENACPDAWNGDGGCDCGCQFVDIDCGAATDRPALSSQELGVTPR